MIISLMSIYTICRFLFFKEVMTEQVLKVGVQNGGIVIPSCVLPSVLNPEGSATIHLNAQAARTVVTKDAEKRAQIEASNEVIDKKASIIANETEGALSKLKRIAELYQRAKTEPRALPPRMISDILDPRVFQLVSDRFMKASTYERLCEERLARAAEIKKKLDNRLSTIITGKMKPEMRKAEKEVERTVKLAKAHNAKYARKYVHTASEVKKVPPKLSRKVHSLPAPKAKKSMSWLLDA
jgi:hypothetical protein